MLLLYLALAGAARNGAERRGALRRGARGRGALRRFGSFKAPSKAGRCTDVLVPNPYFGDIHAEWRPEYDRLTASAKRAKWEARDERVFLRGKLGGLDADAGNTSCEREAGNYARLDAATVGLGDAKAFDIKITHCKPRDGVSRPCARLPLNARHHEAISNSCAKIIGSPVSWTDSKL
ncbi:hypothetical protein M885DRAFT_619622 [Pelagophyceae sp. CCMP2097]|nr:hypothetical protein M885DRAFT_619622 [Pelagophyceae sp. CCMP2097]